MATLAAPLREERSDDRFFMTMAIVMALIVFSGFSFHLAMGRSTFAKPLIVHAHAVVFMGWIVIYVLQNAFVTTGTMTLHRRLGWIGAGWVVAMVVLGTIVTVRMVRLGQAPFFFRPLNFLLFDPLTVLSFAGLTGAAIAFRRQTDWHRRLHYCGMALLLGPAISRMLPSPLLMPYAFEAAFAPTLVFPLIGAVADLRRTGRVHPAWWWGMGAMVAMIVMAEALTHSPIGVAIYHAVTAGSPGAEVAPNAFGAPPRP